jgi:amino-acid N-acetyltransferase
VAFVRSANSTDHIAVIGLLEDAGLPVAGVLPTLPDFYVVELDGRVVGAVGLEVYGRDALLRSAVVERVARNSGLGVTLIERILDHARERDIRAIYLLTTTADQYFPRFGFERIAREDVPDDVKVSVEFREACPASAVVMRKTLERT